MYRSRAFNNYLNNNIKRNTFFLHNFLCKPVKRSIENALTLLKGQAYTNYNIVIPKSAISLTGPAGIWHAKNYKSINIEHVYVPEYSIPTFNTLIKTVNHSKLKNYITVRNIEFFDYFEELIDSGVIFSDIDFDATCTIDSVKQELVKFAYMLPSKLDNLTPVFTLTITLCTRRTGGQTKQAFEETFVKTLKSINKIKILDMNMESYKDVCGSPMMTFFLVLGNSSFIQNTQSITYFKDII